MNFPALQINVTRNNNIESKHYCHIAISKTSQGNLLGWGNIQELYFPRSSIKMFQALEFVMSGAAEHFKCSSKEIALACASHVGDNIHRELIYNWLTRIGLSISNLECGYHAPFSNKAFELLISNKVEKSSLCNNCSGKHVAMLALALFKGYDTSSYTNIKHPVQKDILETMSAFMGFDFSNADWGIDGCGVPTWKIPLFLLASAIHNFAVHSNLNEKQKSAAIIIWNAMTKHPELISGVNTFDTKLMQLGNSEIISKTGAEGVCLFAHKPSGTAVAIKCSDGNERAAQSALGFIVMNSNWYTQQEINNYIPLKSIKTINGKVVGNIQAVANEDQVSSLQKYLSN